jgi:hypothetical protein
MTARIRGLVVMGLLVAFITSPASGHGEGQIHLESLHGKVIGQVGMGPGSYTLEEPLRVQVETRLDGWCLSVRATDLAGDTGRIPAREVCLRPKQERSGEKEDSSWWEDEEIAGDVEGEDTDRMVPMHESRMVVRGGRAGRTALSIPLGIDVGRSRAAGTYTGVVQVGAQHPRGPRSRLLEIPIRVDVRCRVTHGLENTRIYAHYGMPTESISTLVRGRLRTDARMMLSLSVEEGQVNALPLLRAMGRNDRPRATIPLAWTLQEEGASSPRAPDHMSRQGDRISWSLRGTPGDVEYELKCELQPETYQVPGEYGATLQVSLRPEL